MNTMKSNLLTNRYTVSDRYLAGNAAIHKTIDKYLLAEDGRIQSKNVRKDSFVRGGLIA